jgi:hypothetical protein
MKLRLKDFKLLHHALDIMASDYDVDNSIFVDGKPDAYRVKMQKDIEKLRKKLLKIEKGG